MELSFTKEELLYLDDHIFLDIPNSSREFMTKIGTAYLSLEAETNPNSEKEISISLSLDELWIIRDLSQSTIMVGSKPVGKNLKSKVYQKLREINSQALLNSFDDSNERDSKLIRKKINEARFDFLEENNAS